MKFLVGFVLGIVAVLWAGYWFIHHGYFDPRADARISQFERSVAAPAVDNAVSRRAPKLVNPVAANEQNLVLGMRIYQSNCAICHGDIEHRHAALADALLPRAPQFLITAADMPENQNFYIIKHGIRMTGMPSWNTILSDQQIWEVTTFLSRMNNLPPAIAQQWKAQAGGAPADSPKPSAPAGQGPIPQGTTY